MNLTLRRRPAPLLVASSVGLLLATTVVVRTQFRAQTTLVLIDVVVRDASGNTVDDLDRADFTLLENGVARTIVAFERGGAGARDGDTASNQPYRWNTSPRALPQSMTAAVFHHLDPQARVAAVGAVRQMIASLDGSDFVGIFTLEESLIELAPFTRDVTVLSAALDAVARTPSAAPATPGASEAGPSLDSTGRGGSDAAAMRARMESGLAELDKHYAAGLQGTAFSGLIAGLSQFPGRRAVFLYSRGLATPDVLPKLEGVVASAKRQHVSFYCIDASGLGTGRRPQSKRSISRGDLTSSNEDDLERRVKIAERDTTGGLGPLADLTGGMLVSDTNDIAAGTTRANDDRRHYYLLGYSSGEGVDPERAVVTVRVGRPGVQVRARTKIGGR